MLVNTLHGHHGGPAPRLGGPDRARGFTLIELLVTFVVVAVMLTLAAPSFVSIQRDSQLRSAANDFLAAVTAARAEAMKRQLNVYVRPGTPISPSNDWSQGWFLYVDGDWDAAYTPGSSDVLLNQQAALPSGVAMSPVPQQGTTCLAVQSDEISPFVLMSGAGFATDKTSAVVTGQALNVSNSSGSRWVIINGSGRVRVCNPNSDTGCNCGAFF